MPDQPTAHTPGPWTKLQRLNERYVIMTDMPSGDGLFIAEVDNPADAVLIAAAPTTLKELRGALPYLEDAADAGSFKALEQLQSARAAIAKATKGGS